MLSIDFETDTHSLYHLWRLLTTQSSGTLRFRLQSQQMNLTRGLHWDLYQYYPIIKIRE